MLLTGNTKGWQEAEMLITGLYHTIALSVDIFILGKLIGGSVCHLLRQEEEDYRSLDTEGEGTH